MVRVVVVARASVACDIMGPMLDTGHIGTLPGFLEEHISAFIMNNNIRIFTPVWVIIIYHGAN